MSDEQKDLEEQEVEGHVRKGVTDEPSVEDEGEVEAHVRKANVRLDNVRKD